MAATWGKFNLAGLTTKKCTSQGQGGRGRRTKIATSTMNKSRKRSHKKYKRSTARLMHRKIASQLEDIKEMI